MRIKSNKIWVKLKLGINKNRGTGWNRVKVWPKSDTLLKTVPILSCNETVCQVDKKDKENGVKMEKTYMI